MHKKTTHSRILIAVVKWRHRAIVLLLVRSRSKQGACSTKSVSALGRGLFSSCLLNTIERRPLLAGTKQITLLNTMSSEDEAPCMHCYFRTRQSVYNRLYPPPTPSRSPFSYKIKLDFWLALMVTCHYLLLHCYWNKPITGKQHWNENQSYFMRRPFVPRSMQDISRTLLAPFLSEGFERRSITELNFFLY